MELSVRIIVLNFKKISSIYAKYLHIEEFANLAAFLKNNVITIGDFQKNDINLILSYYADVEAEFQYTNSDSNRALRIMISCCSNHELMLIRAIDNDIRRYKTEIN